MVERFLFFYTVKQVYLFISCIFGLQILKVLSFEEHSMKREEGRGDYVIGDPYHLSLSLYLGTMADGSQTPKYIISYIDDEDNEPKIHGRYLINKLHAG